MFPGTHARTHPDKPALIMAASGESVTYRELDDEANRLARLLRERGLERGDHLVFCLDNHMRALPVMWGAHYAGLYYTAASARLTAAEIAYLVHDSGARAIISCAAAAPTMVEVRELSPRLTVCLSVDGPIAGFEDYRAAVRTQPAEPLADRRQGRDMLYSSGTTGRPKGIKRPLPDLRLDDPDPEAEQCAELFGAGPDTVYLSPAPLYHAAPLRFCRAVQRLGGTAVVMDRFEPEAFLSAVQKFGATWTQLVPTMMNRLVRLDEGVRGGYDVSSMRAIVHAAAPCPIPVKRAFIDWFGPIVHEYYGATEANGFVYCTSEEWLAHPGTVGRAVTGILHILDADGNECPTGEIGSIYFEAEQPFEYHNDAAKTQESLDVHGRGWSTLGDVGYLDADGFLYLTDRKSYLIITGGANVYPQEAEQVLAVHPKVADVAVIGVPNDDLGEEVKAVVQVVDWSDATPELAAELIEYCRTQLAPVKCPRSVDFRRELPREPTGKLLKRRLKDEYWAGAGRAI